MTSEVAIASRRGSASANTMVRDPGVIIEKEQVGRYSSANRRSTSCSILLREGAITREAKADSRKTRRVDWRLDDRDVSPPRLGLGEFVLGYRDSFLTLVLSCTPSRAFRIGH